MKKNKRVPVTEIPDSGGIMRALAEGINYGLNGETRPNRYGFVLLVAEFGQIDGGRVSYVSNGQRADMITMLREYLGRLEGRTHEPPEKMQ